MSGDHAALTTALINGWIDATDCDRLTAEIRADEELGMMHEAETCPVCHPALPCCGRPWHACTCGDVSTSSTGPAGTCSGCGGPVAPGHDQPDCMRCCW